MPSRSDVERLLSLGELPAPTGLLLSLVVPVPRTDEFRRSRRAAGRRQGTGRRPRSCCGGAVEGIAVEVGPAGEARRIAAGSPYRSRKTSRATASARSAAVPSEYRGPSHLVPDVGDVAGLRSCEPSIRLAPIVRAGVCEAVEPGPHEDPLRLIVCLAGATGLGAGRFHQIRSDLHLVGVERDRHRLDGRDW